MYHKRVYAAAICAAMLLCCGCSAEAKDRAYAEIMAVHCTDTVQGAIRYGEESTAADAQTPALLPDALRQKSGTAIYTGHLTTLLVSGRPFSALLPLAQAQWVAPDCTLICTKKNAANLLAAGEEDLQSLYRQAAKSGAVPLYDTGEILGMLQNDAQIAAVPYFAADSFTLALYDAADEQYAILSDAACRGIALYDGAWEKFQFAANGGTCTVTKCSIACSLTETEEALVITAECSARCDAPSSAAEAVIREYLIAALQETLSVGADLFFLQERAIRDGISWAADASPATWQNALKQAGFTVTVALT